MHQGLGLQHDLMEGTVQFNALPAPRPLPLPRLNVL